MPGQRRFVQEQGGGLDGTQRQLDEIGLELESIDETIASGLAAVPYTPLDATDWTAPAPTNLQQALDRIAAAIGPIP